ncbi:hypothetical protein ACVWZ3_009335 [Bradyrhizobium sp. i1.3.6]
MRIAVIGGGPGGLYFAYLWKKRHPEDQVDLFEQNPADATWGFGVVFSDQALEFLRADDPETVDAIAPHMESWENITLNLHGDSVAIDGVGFSSIGRLELLQFLQQRALDAGVTPRFDTQIHAIDQLNGHDLIVAADGLNSLVRRAYEGDFGTSLSYSSNKFVWYGTSKRFDTLSQTFVKTDRGAFNAHHYRYSPTMSTFLVECDHATWQAYGFAYKDAEQCKGVCEEVFADTLGGHCLVSNKSVWRNFPPGSGTSTGRSRTWCCSATPCTRRISPSARGRGSRSRTPSRWSRRWSRMRICRPRCTVIRPRENRWCRSSSMPRAPRPSGTSTSPSTCSSA